MYSVPAGSPFTALRNGDPAALAALNYRMARSGDPAGTVKKCNPGWLYFVFVITQQADELQGRKIFRPYTAWMCRDAKFCVLYFEFGPRATGAQNVFCPRRVSLYGFA